MGRRTQKEVAGPERYWLRDGESVVIYGLRDSRTGLFSYVGQTKDPKHRFYDHRSLGCVGTVGYWMCKLQIAGIPVEMCLLDTVKEKEEPLLLEWGWMRKLLLSGHPLFNTIGLHKPQWRIHGYNTPAGFRLRHIRPRFFSTGIGNPKVIYTLDMNTVSHSAKDRMHEFIKLCEEG